MYAYNCTRCDVTGYSPFYLLYGRSPRLPIDILFGLHTEVGSRNQRDYVDRWKRGMEEAYAIAAQNAKKSAERGKKYYDTKVRGAVLQPGERVLIKNLTPRGGTGKLRNYWEDTIHLVVKQMGSDLPIYEVKPERGNGRSRVLHRNLLMPCDYLPLETPAEITTRVTQCQESDEDSGDEYELHYELPHVPTEPTEGLHLNT